MTCVIKDLYTGEYYTGKAGAHGYYHPILGRARLYSKREYANSTINNNDHHVTWPGNRTLVIRNVKIEETK